MLEEQFCDVLRSFLICQHTHPKCIYSISIRIKNCAPQIFRIFHYIFVGRHAARSIRTAVFSSAHRRHLQKSEMRVLFTSYDTLVETTTSY
jgi:hypothetical protein